MTNLRETLRGLDGVAFGRTVPTRGQRRALASLQFLMAITMSAFVVALIVGTSATVEDMWPGVLIGPATGLVVVGVAAARARRSGHNQEAPAGRRRGR
ncbi:MAG: hypothetical protein ACT452_04280 [Microthrixaceae bacterium]